MPRKPRRQEWTEDHERALAEAWPDGPGAPSRNVRSVAAKWGVSEKRLIQVALERSTPSPPACSAPPPPRSSTRQRRLREAGQSGGASPVGEDETLQSIPNRPPKNKHSRESDRKSAEASRLRTAAQWSLGVRGVFRAPTQRELGPLTGGLKTLDSRAFRSVQRSASACTIWSPDAPGSQGADILRIVAVRYPGTVVGWLVHAAITEGGESARPPCRAQREHTTYPFCRRRRGEGPAIHPFVVEERAG